MSDGKAIQPVTTAASWSDKEEEKVGKPSADSGLMDIYHQMPKNEPSDVLDGTQNDEMLSPPEMVKIRKRSIYRKKNKSPKSRKACNKHKRRGQYGVDILLYPPLMFTTSSIVVSSRSVQT